MLRIDVRTTVDQQTRREVLALIDEVTGLQGRRPVGEHKYAHLLSGPDDWVGVLAYAEDALVGYAHTRWNPPGERPRMAAEVVVHPERGGRRAERRLLEEIRRVLAQAGGGSLYLWVHQVVDPAATTPAQMGFAVQRELAFMTRPLQDPPEPALPPEGIRLGPYRPGTDDDAFLAVNNAAFRGHPENGGWTAADLAQRREPDWFEPTDVLMAWRGDQALGFHWTKRHGHDSEEVPAHEAVGEVYVLAVHPAAAGTGLGRFLLQAGLRHLWERDCRLAVLYVDRASEVAMGLYARHGFVQESLEVCYEDQVAAQVRPDGSDLLRPA